MITNNFNSIDSQLSSGGNLPTGLISLWYGATDAIPEGWALCDGQNGTPDLRDRFVVGAGDSYAVGATGGSDTVTLTTAQMPGHNHSWYYNTYPQTNQGYPTVFSVWSGEGKVTQGRVDATITTTSTGSGSAHENRPPYYALCYIMKL